MQSNPEAQNQIPAVAQHAPPPPGPQPGYNPFSNTNDSAHAPQEDEDFVFEAFARTRLQQQTWSIQILKTANAQFMWFSFGWILLVLVTYHVTHSFHVYPCINFTKFKWRHPRLHEKIRDVIQSAPLYFWAPSRHLTHSLPQHPKSHNMDHSYQPVENAYPNPISMVKLPYTKVSQTQVIRMKKS